MRAHDTIYAVSTGAPPAAIAIVRVSGSSAFAVAQALAGTLPAARRATLRPLHDSDGALLDRAIVLVFPAPRTATGEDLIEFHVHGGRAVVASVERAIAALPDSRRAEPGEFTRRALENGVIDLTAAEGLGDLLSARTETQRRAALRIDEGGLRTLLDGWTDRLIEIAARIEAQLDFSDEDDVAEEALSEIIANIAHIAEQIDDLVSQPPVERLHDGVRIVIAGPPNSGKSTLLNALAGRDVAIVSPISGTTRDRIEAPVERAGVAYLLTDTAGLTDTPGDVIEQIGIDRAQAAIDAADLVLWLGDEPPPVTGHLHVHARADLPERRHVPSYSDAVVSASTGSGLAALWTLIAQRASLLLPQGDSITTNARQRDLLRSALDHLRATAHLYPLIVAEELRGALRNLDAVAGRAGVEAILDSLFARFCIGK